MSFESLIPIIITVVSTLSAPIVYVWRSMNQRIDKLEEKLDRKIDEDEVRTLVNDRLTPINQNIDEVKSLLYQMLLKLNKE